MTTTYHLYLESGPKRKKTMVHVLDLLGCVAVGPTTEDALAAIPAAIETFRRFLQRTGEAVDTSNYETTIEEHITEGEWLGNGSPYIVFGPDLEPIDEDEMELYLQRFTNLLGALADWAEQQSDADLDAAPDVRGRTARAILLLVLGSAGGFFGLVLGGAPGFSALHSATERGEVELATALRRAAEMAVALARTATPEQRAAIRELPAGPRTMRKALRRMLEHAWEHLAELARRPGGPAL